MKNKITFIAELCQNHLGKKDLLKKMTYDCAENGADIIKIQNIYAKNLTYRPRFEKGLKIGNKIESIIRPYKLEFNRLRKLELSYKDNEYFIRLCNDLKIIPMTTCFTREHVKILKNIGYSHIKVASYDCSSFSMLRELNQYFKKIILSTGASYDQEILKAVNIIDKKKLSLLHCVTIYPTLKKQLHLSRIGFLKKLCKHVGFSDHSPVNKDKNFSSCAAIYYGAEIIERHMTILDGSLTKDGPVSINPKDILVLKKFSLLSKNDQKQYLKSNYKFNFKTIYGSSKRKLSNAEILNRDYYKGRFASLNKNMYGPKFIYNWEETDLN